MAVMVNSNSASASEVFAAALQDYDRAVIVGGKQTFGKGTVQRFINLDDIVNANMDPYKPFGALKLTFQKFYRISGGSTQLEGVVPDIILPDNYRYFDYGERELDYHLPWDEIAAATYEKSGIMDRKAIEKASKSRVKSNEKFALIDEQAKLINDYRNMTNVSLNFEQYREDQEKRKEEGHRFDSIFADTTLVQIFPLKADWQFIEKDSAKVKSNKQWHKKLSADLYLRESIEVVEAL
jgi:carboxyl-terminal processing protease